MGGIHSECLRLKSESARIERFSYGVISFCHHVNVGELEEGSETGWLTWLIIVPPSSYWIVVWLDH